MLAAISVGAGAVCAFAYARSNRSFTWTLRTVPRPVELESGDVSTANEVYFINVQGGRIGFGHQDPNATWIPPIVNGKPFQVWWDLAVTFPAIVPAWVLGAIAMVTGTPVVVAARRSIAKRRRAAAQLCITCGYDLRATPERCPECGLIPAARGAV